MLCVCERTGTEVCRGGKRSGVASGQNEDEVGRLRVAHLFVHLRELVAEARHEVARAPRVSVRRDPRWRRRRHRE